MNEIERSILMDAGLTEHQMKLVDDIVEEAVETVECAEPPGADCEHVGLRAEVMCQLMRNHATVASESGVATFDSDQIVSDFHKIWEAIEG